MATDGWFASPLEPEVLRIEDLERLAECEASWPRPGPALRIPADRQDAEAPALRRWKHVRDAIVAWHRSASPDDGLRAARECLAPLDAVEREECERQLATYTQTSAHGQDLRADPPAGEWIDPTGEYAVRVPATFTTRTTGERPTAVRLRTGRARTDPLSAAVMQAVPTDADYVDALLATREGLVEMETPATDWIDRLTSLTDRLGHLPPPARRRAVPGRSCFDGCQRVPYCEAFPVLDGEGRPPTSSRLLVLSKTAIATALRCQRRAAWRYVYHLPEDDSADRVDDADTGPGRAAHELLADLVLESTPTAALADLLVSVSTVDRGFVGEIARRHLALEAEGPHHPVRYRRSEITAGVCFDLRDVVGSPTVVAVLARLDAIGREPDGTPAVVEHKTGRAVIEVEADLYAVVGWHLAARLGTPAGLAVHHHWLGTGDHAVCERTAYTPDEIRAATARVRSIAEVAAAWDPADALSPPPRSEYDAYCRSCPYERRCGRHGGPTAG